MKFKQYLYEDKSNKEISEKDIYEIIHKLVNLRGPTICRHAVCCYLLSMLERNGYKIDKNLVKHIVDGSEGDYEANKCLRVILGD